MEMLGVVTSKMWFPSRTSRSVNNSSSSRILKMWDCTAVTTPPGRSIREIGARSPPLKKESYLLRVRVGSQLPQKACKGAKRQIDQLRQPPSAPHLGSSPLQLPRHRGVVPEPSLRHASPQSPDYRPLSSAAVLCHLGPRSLSAEYTLPAA